MTKASQEDARRSMLRRAVDSREDAFPGVGPLGDDDVADYPRFEFSMKDVKRAGKVISGSMPWTDETKDEIIRAFQIANNWRDSHAYPMKSVRSQVIYYLRELEIDGSTFARLKRMQAIHRKLRRIAPGLDQLQDLGGCRAIVPTVDDVRTVAQAIRHRSGHEFRADDDYISRPKSDGYRSHHLKLNFNGTRTQNHNGRRIEIQVRTRLRHSWATAVEAVGMFRGEHLKSHQGSDAWLRLFTLMSAEFALSEGCPVPPNVPDQATRILEIKALDKELKAIDTLENLSQAVRWTEEYVQPDDVVPKYYLIRYDNKTI